MLLSYSLGNFRSILEEQTLSMVASNRHPDHPEHLCPVPDSEERLLRAAVVYGANGSGKSNLIKGLRFIRHLVTTGTQPGKAIPRQAFLFQETSRKEPSSFQLRFVQDGRLFDFGFKVTDHEVVEEWLFLLKGNRETKLFERITKDGKSRVEVGAGLKDAALGDHAKVLALAQIGVRENQLFLAAVREGLNASDHGVLAGVLRWIHSLSIVMPDANFRPLAEWVAANPLFTQFAGRFLHEASTGVAGLRVDSAEVTEQSGFPPELLKEMLGDAAPGEVRVKRLPLLGDVILQRGEGSKALMRTIRAEHLDDRGQSVPLPLAEESDGTQRLTNLLPALFQLQGEQRIFVIDEIDRSLHPLLAKKFVEFFLRSCGKQKSQLILTTHESNLMDLDLLRRDELWFTEKDPRGATSLYSLTDFKVRTDLKIDKGYLHGRFGAIPFLGNLDRLAEETMAEAACR